MANTDVATRCRSARGQAVIETILTTWTLLMLLCILMQAFLIDQHAYRLATRAHARLFRDAYSGNLPGRSYADVTAKLEGNGDEYVPVIGYFHFYGLTREDLRIRSPLRPLWDPAKRLTLGRGTAGSVSGALKVDPSPYLSAISSGLKNLQDAKTKAEQVKAAGTKKGGK